MIFKQKPFSVFAHTFLSHIASDICSKKSEKSHLKLLQKIQDKVAVTSQKKIICIDHLSFVVSNFGGNYMSKPVILRKRAKIVALIVFLLGLLIISLLGTWWPGIMLVVGLPLAILQYLQGRIYDMSISLFVFVGAWITVQFNIQWQVFLPVLFAIGGIYIFFREWIESRSSKEEEFEEDKDESKKDQ